MLYFRQIRTIFKRYRSLILYSVITFLLFVNFTKPFIHQDPAYNFFADTRTELDIPNFLNIISNAIYLIVGLSGLRYLIKPSSDRHFYNTEEKVFYYFFFAGVLATFFGSSYYHFNPTDTTLVWDRLPMSTVFISLFFGILYDRVSKRLALRLFLPALLVGIASVVYWHLSETIIPGGDLRFYLDVQYYTLLLIPFILYSYKSHYAKNSYELKVLLFYLLAKIFEVYDHAVFVITSGFVSGHTVKHLVSGYATYMLIKMIKSRKIEK